MTMSEGSCTTDVLMIFLRPSLSSASLRVLARGSSVHSSMLSCQHFFGLPRLLPPGTVPCMMVFASPVARVTCPYHLSFLVLTIKRRSSCGPMVALTRFLTSSFVILSLNEMLITHMGQKEVTLSYLTLFKHKEFGFINLSTNSVTAFSCGCDHWVSITVTTQTAMPLLLAECDLSTLPPYLALDLP